MGWQYPLTRMEWSYSLSDRPETVDDSDGRRSYASPEPQTELTTWIFDEGTFVPSAKLVGERRYSIISDYLGTPIEAYDEEGQRVWGRELDIYGRVRMEQGEVGLIPFLYQGQYLDGETGLAYNRFRYYSPETGAYISQDPIRLEAGLSNLYAYVHDVNVWVDPLGLMPDWMKTMKGYQRHHIIPQSLQVHPLFVSSGMNIDGASNMKYLPIAEGIDPNPNKAIHLGWNDVHREYNQMMKQRMDELYDISKVEGWDQRRIQKEVIGLQTEVRQGLDSGKYKTH